MNGVYQARFTMGQGVLSYWGNSGGQERIHTSEFSMRTCTCMSERMICVHVLGDTSTRL